MIEKLRQDRFTREPMESERQVEQRTGDDRRETTPHQEYLELRLRTFFSKMLGVMVVLGVSNAIALLGFGIVLGKESDLTDKIQRERYDALVTNCAETNQRYKDVNSRIDDAIAKLPPKGQKAAETKARPFRLIISAAVPFTQDCPAYAESRVKGNG